jgi:hypothetical protein
MSTPSSIPPSDDPQQQVDPYVEPANSTVTDWHGQVEHRQEDLADDAMSEAGGDMDEAERIFKDRGGDEPEELAP